MSTYLKEEYLLTLHIVQKLTFHTIHACLRALIIHRTHVLQSHLVAVLTLHTVHMYFFVREYSPYTQCTRTSMPPALLFSGRDSDPSSASPSSPHFSVATGSSAVHEPYLHCSDTCEEISVCSHLTIPTPVYIKNLPQFILDYF